MRDRRWNLLEAIARTLREPVDVSPSFDARVMDAVHTMPRHSRASGRGGLWSRITRPRTITVTPLSWALLAASLLIVLGAGAIGSFGTGSDRSASGSRRSGTGAGSAQPVQFVLVAPTARKVAVVGDFNGWDATHAAYQALDRGG